MDPGGDGNSSVGMWKSSIKAAPATGHRGLLDVVPRHTPVDHSGIEQRRDGGGGERVAGQRSNLTLFWKCIEYHETSRRFFPES